MWDGAEYEIVFIKTLVDSVIMHCACVHTDSGGGVGEMGGCRWYEQSHHRLHVLSHVSVASAGRHPTPVPSWNLLLRRKKARGDPGL